MSDRILIVGAGQAGKSLAEELQTLGTEVIGYVDDNVSNDSVLGNINVINKVISAEDITHVYIALPSVGGKRIREIYNSIQSDEVNIAIIPHESKILKKAKANISDLEELDIEKLIGRPPLKEDIKSLITHLEDQTVLITGAAGSIGSEIVRQIADLSSARVIAVDWWENGIFHLQQELKIKSNIEYKVCNIQNYNSLNRIFTESRPDIVFHAAAYKHVPLMESSPIEAFNNNVLGTKNVLQICATNKVKEYVQISTDKAVNPTNIMGATKRIAEWYLKEFAGKYDSTTFTAVRFGNVIGSNGSVIPLFKRQIKNGGPVTLTDENITRFFMTIPEAVHLVLSSLKIPERKDGDIFILDMGEEVKISDIARSMIKSSGKKVDIEIIGLRPGDKMKEELSYNPDEVGKTTNPKVFISERISDGICNNILGLVDQMLEKTSNYTVSPIELKQFISADLGFNINEA